MNMHSRLTHQNRNTLRTKQKHKSSHVFIRSCRKEMFFRTPTRCQAGMQTLGTRQWKKTQNSCSFSQGRQIMNNKHSNEVNFTVCSGKKNKREGCEVCVAGRRRGGGWWFMKCQGRPRWEGLDIKRGGGEAEDWVTSQAEGTVKGCLCVSSATPLLQALVQYLIALFGLLLLNGENVL